jgi:hypothetical protein
VREATNLDLYRASANTSSSQGQLGLNDTSSRLRPELVRALRNASARSVAAGAQHSMVISPNGVLFGFGSNSHGQLGVGEEGPDVRFISSPTAVDRLRGGYEPIQATCGHAHTLVLCADTRGSLSNRRFVFAMGLNSSGQLGLGHTSSARTPSLVRLPADSGCPVAVISGPLAFHSFVVTEGASVAPPQLPSVNLAAIRAFCAYANATPTIDSVKLRRFRENIAAAFSAISVLNSSFKREPSSEGSKAFNLDMVSVREAYQLITSISNKEACDLITSTLGRATLLVGDELKSCPFDDAESLSVFLIILENPLLLSASKYHVALQRVSFEITTLRIINKIN